MSSDDRIRNKSKEVVDNIQAKATHDAFVLVKLCPQSLALQQAQTILQ